jgi:hypothetical protein
VFLFDTQSVIKNRSGEVIQGIKASSEVVTYEFGLGRKGRKPSLKLWFVDYPGRYIEQGATEEERTFICELLKTSHAIIIAIDAPALIENNSVYNEIKNATTYVTALFENYYQELVEPRLVIFAPLRSEKYMSELEDATKLHAALRKEYERLFNLFNALKDNVAVVITPVQTLGGFVLSTYKEENAMLSFRFRKKNQQAVYAPVDNEQPLRYVLRFLLKMHHSERATSWSIFSFLRGWFHLDRHLTNAVTTFAGGSKKDGGFEIVQGDHLLNL